jgi:MoaA/NifB/PqqE/SkfB family radical SAM enzyme
MPAQDQPFLPDAYLLPGGNERTEFARSGARVIFIEITNRCNLLCQTCPRTYFTREKLKTLTFDEYLFIAEQFPAMQRAILHGIGEPLLNRQLPQIIEYLKAQGIQVLINSNGTLLTPAWQDKIVTSGLDEYRCSIDGATKDTYARIRGKDMLAKVTAGLEGLLQTRDRSGSKTPLVSIWCVATQENLAEIPDLVRLAARLGVKEVYLQRMVYFSKEKETQYGMAQDEQAIFGRKQADQEKIIAECEMLSQQLGVHLNASGARDPRNSLAAARTAESAPWKQCTRPWTTAYVTANGNCLPCCISPFATSNYYSLIMGNVFHQSFQEIWNGERYRQFRAQFLSLHPHQACAGCGVGWSI